MMMKYDRSTATGRIGSGVTRYCTQVYINNTLLITNMVKDIQYYKLLAMLVRSCE